MWPYLGILSHISVSLHHYIWIYFGWTVLRVVNNKQGKAKQAYNLDLLSGKQIYHCINCDISKQMSNRLRSAIRIKENNLHILGKVCCWKGKHILQRFWRIQFLAIIYLSKRKYFIEKKNLVVLRLNWEFVSYQLQYVLQNCQMLTLKSFS